MKLKGYLDVSERKQFSGREAMNNPVKEGWGWSRCSCRIEKECVWKEYSRSSMEELWVSTSLEGPKIYSEFWRYRMNCGLICLLVLFSFTITINIQAIQFHILRPSQYRIEGEKRRGSWKHSYFHDWGILSNR